MEFPGKIDNPERIRQLITSLQGAVEAHEHNSQIEALIAKHGDEDGMLANQYVLPRFWIHSLLIMAQITDDEDDPMQEETFFIKEGGPVLFQEDGAKNTATPFRDLPSVMCW